MAVPAPLTRHDELLRIGQEGQVPIVRLLYVLRLCLIVHYTALARGWVSEHNLYVILQSVETQESQLVIGSPLDAWYVLIAVLAHINLRDLGCLRVIDMQ